MKQSVQIIVGQEDISGVESAAARTPRTFEPQSILVKTSAHIALLASYRTIKYNSSRIQKKGLSVKRKDLKTIWGEKDLNLRRRSQQIYSLPPLTTREPPHCAKKKLPKNIFSVNTALKYVSRFVFGYAILRCATRHEGGNTHAEAKKISSSRFIGGFKILRRQIVHEVTADQNM